MAQLGYSKSREAKSRIRGKLGGGGGVKGNLRRGVLAEKRGSLGNAMWVVTVLKTFDYLRSMQPWL